MPDDACGAWQYFGRIAANVLRRQLAHRRRVAIALLAGAGVGVSGIDHDRAELSFGDVVATHFHRGGKNAIGRKHCRGGGECIAHQNANVRRPLRFDAGVHRARAKAAR